MCGSLRLQGTGLVPWVNCFLQRLLSRLKAAALHPVIKLSGVTAVLSLPYLLPNLPLKWLFLCCSELSLLIQYCEVDLDLVQGPSLSPLESFEAAEVACRQGNVLALYVGLNFSLLPAPLSACGYRWAAYSAWERWDRAEGGWR